MTTDCFTDLDVGAHIDTDRRHLGALLAEYGAAAITAIGFVLLLPAAALILPLISH